MLSYRQTPYAELVCSLLVNFKLPSLTIDQLQSILDTLDLPLLQGWPHFQTEVSWPSLVRRVSMQSAFFTWHDNSCVLVC